MQNLSGLKSLLLALSLLISGNAIAVDNEDLIEARQGLMKLYGVNMDILNAMIRGNFPYDQKKAQSIAENLYALTKMNHAPLWRRGTSQADRGMQNQTSAKPELWQNQADVSDRHAQLIQAAEVLAKNAGWSVDALEENIGDVNRTCKGCHKKYRSKK